VPYALFGKRKKREGKGNQPFRTILGGNSNRKLLEQKPTHKREEIPYLVHGPVAHALLFYDELDNHATLHPNIARKFERGRIFPRLLESEA
jgi:hypothetical protein